MSLTTSLWKVDSGRLMKVARSTLENEKQLEDWLAEDPELLGRDLLIFGRQTRTFSGPLDLLAIDGEGELVVIELKRDRTPREVVAQVLDYASWIRRLAYEQLDQICQNHCSKTLAVAFQEHFGSVIPEAAGTRHSMVIVASELDDSSERIVEYLQEEHDVNINAVYFTTFEIEGRKVLARSWFADPTATTERIEAKRQRPWSGLWFVNNGVDGTNGRDWEKCIAFGFVSAGGAPKYSEPLRKLNPGDQVVAYHKGAGYVGYGIVRAPAMPASMFTIPDGRTLSEAIPNLNSRIDHPDGQEYAVAIEWKSAVPVSQAKKFPGIFAKQHIVCRLRDESTIDFVRKEFAIPSA